MNKKQLIENVATKMEAKKTDAAKCVDVVISCVMAGVIDDALLQLIGFGSFKKFIGHYHLYCVHSRLGKKQTSQSIRHAVK